MNIPSNLFIQNINVNIESLNISIDLNVVFGVEDNLTETFNSSNWKIMNKNWKEFSMESTIVENDLWNSNIKLEARNLMNARLYTVVNTHIDGEKMDFLNEFFWIEIVNNKENTDLVDK